MNTCISHISKTISNSILWGLAILFIISALSKAINIYSFASETLLFTEAYMPTFLCQFNQTLAVSTCFLELLAGLLLLNHKLHTTGIILASILTLLFLYLTGVNLFFPPSIGSIESCGCFGEFIHFTPVASFTKSIFIFLALLLYIALWSTNLSIQINKHDLLHLYSYIIISIVPPLYSFFLLHKLPNIWYLVGYLILCICILINIFAERRRHTAQTDKRKH